MTALDKARYGIHRAGTVKRNNRNYIVYTLGAQILKHLLHPRRLKLENSCGVAARDKLKGLFIVKWYLFNVEIRLKFLDLGFGIVYNRQVSQSQEVELEKSEVGNGVHIKLRDYRTVADRQRHVLTDRLIGNYHACRVNRNISGHSFKRNCGVDKLLYLLRAVVKLLKLGKTEGVFQCDSKLARNSLCHHVNVGIGHSHSSSAVAYRRLCRKSTKGNYLRHVFSAVFSRHVFDNLVAAIIAEIHINIGHTYSLGIEESLKEQVEFDRINIGDSKQICYKASRARSTSGAYGYVGILCKSNVILHDKEIVGVSHGIYNGKLVIYAISIRMLVVMSLVTESEVTVFLSAIKSCKGQFAQIFLCALAAGTWEFGQENLVKFKLKLTRVGNFNGIFNSTCVCAVNALHFIGGFDIIIVHTKGGLVLAIKSGVGLNAHQDLLNFGILTSEIVTVVGCHHGKTGLFGKSDEKRHKLARLLCAVILQFNIEIILTKYRRIVEGGLFSSVNVARRQESRNLARKAGRQSDKPLAVCAEQLLVDTGLGVKALRIT